MEEIRKRTDGLYEKTGIYGIINTANGKVYVGQTTMNFGDRRDSHFSSLRHGKHPCTELQNDYIKYGDAAFAFVVLCECGPEEIDRYESLFIEQYMEHGMAYNKCTGGRVGYKGPPISEEAKRMIGEKNRIHGLGRKASEETKQKMSAAHRGKKFMPLSDERKANLSRALSGEHGGLAKLTEEQVLEIRRLRREENLTYAEIGRRFGVTYQCVSDICNYKRWKYTA